MAVKGVSKLAVEFSLIEEPTCQFCMLGSKLSQTHEVNPPLSGHLAIGAGTVSDSVAFKFGDARKYGHNLWSKVDTRA